MRHTTVVLSLCLFATSRTAAAQAVTTRAGFVTTLGRDTVAIESFERTPLRLEGDLLVRVPSTVLIHYRIDMKTPALVSRSFVEFKPFDATVAAARRVTLDFIGDSVQVTKDSAGRTTHLALPGGDGLMPAFTTGFGSSFGLYASLAMHEQILKQEPLRTGEPTRVRAVGVTSGQAAFQTFVRRSDSQVDVDYFDMAWTHLMVGDDNRILAADARATTEQTQSQRTPYLDVVALADQFAQRDRTGQALGIASPNQTVRHSVGSARLTLTFGSPRLRGRSILGEVVPYDMVWRTGANEATVMSVDRDVTIGGKRVPAGTYSVWTLPSTSGVGLIINREHGQWGTTYHQAQDLIRLPMSVSTVDPAREQFVIDIVSTGGASELRIMWDHFRWSVPVTDR